LGGHHPASLQPAKIAAVSALRGTLVGEQEIEIFNLHAFLSKEANEHVLSIKPTSYTIS